MFIYSVTIHILKENEVEWLEYMQQKHIADVLKTGFFSKAIMRKEIHKENENRVSYNTEYFTETIEKYDTYVQVAAPVLQKDVIEKFGGKFTAERKFYEVIIEL